MRKKVLITGNIPRHVVESLEKFFTVSVHTEDKPMERDKLTDAVRDINGLMSMITDNVNEDLMCRAPYLEMIANMAVGYNNIDVDAATRRGLPVSNTPGVLTDTTADVAFTLILSAARRVVEGDRMVREGRFRYWAPFLFLGTEVTGKTLGIIGMGRIGKAVARRAGDALTSRSGRFSVDQHRALGQPAAPAVGKADLVPLSALTADPNLDPLVHRGDREIVLARTAVNLDHLRRDHSRASSGATLMVGWCGRRRAPTVPAAWPTMRR